MRSVWAIDEPSFVDWMSKVANARMSSAPGAVGHSPKRILVAAPGPQLEHDRAELLREQRVRGGHFHADARECRFEAEAGLDADEHQVERIGKGVDQRLLAPVGLGADEQARQVEAQRAPRSRARNRA